jgi:hypothetical protein
MINSIIESDFGKDNDIASMPIEEIKENFYIAPRFNDLASYEVSLECLEIALSKGVPFAIKNLQNAFNVVDPKHRMSIKEVLDDDVISVINHYKDQTEIFILLNITQGHHYFHPNIKPDLSKQLWLKHKVVEHIMEKFKN